MSHSRLAKSSFGGGQRPRLTRPQEIDVRPRPPWVLGSRGKIRSRDVRLKSWPVGCIEPIYSNLIVTDRDAPASVGESARGGNRCCALYDGHRLQWRGDGLERYLGDNPLAEWPKRSPRSSGCEARPRRFTRVDRRNDAVDVVAGVGNILCNSTELVPQRDPLGVEMEPAGCSDGDRCLVQHCDDATEVSRPHEKSVEGVPKRPRRDGDRGNHPDDRNRSDTAMSRARNSSEMPSNAVRAGPTQPPRDCDIARREIASSSRCAADGDGSFITREVWILSRPGAGLCDPRGNGGANPSVGEKNARMELWSSPPSRSAPSMVATMRP